MRGRETEHLFVLNEKVTSGTLGQNNSESTDHQQMAADYTEIVSFTTSVPGS